MIIELFLGYACGAISTVLIREEMSGGGFWRQQSSFWRKQSDYFQGQVQYWGEKYLLEYKKREQCERVLDRYIESGLRPIESSQDEHEEEVK
ncbi:MAG: hypothetical protein ACYCZQ_03155 [Burkholderiales bacterium]